MPPKKRKAEAPAYQRHHNNSHELREYVRRASGDTVILSFSCGKDAIAAWLALRPHFARVVPFYLYLIPGLSFIEEGLRYFEDFFGEKILRFPQPNLYRMLKDRVFQPPERFNIIEEAGLTALSYDEIETTVRARIGRPEAFMATGVRSADSPNRRTAIMKHGSLNPSRKVFYPVYDWNIADVDRAIRQARVRMPVDYRLFGRTFDGIDERFLYPLKEHYPADFRRILEWFPLAELMLHRRRFLNERRVA